MYVLKLWILLPTEMSNLRFPDAMVVHTAPHDQWHKELFKQ